MSFMKKLEGQGMRIKKREEEIHINFGAVIAPSFGAGSLEKT